MNNILVLKFDNTLTNLAGYDYGHKIYDEQVKGNIDITKNFCFEFPSNIKGIASSFVQGLFAEIIKSIGLGKTEERLSIKSQNQGFDKLVLSKLV